MGAGVVGYFGLLFDNSQTNKVNTVSDRMRSHHG